jgi:hypothetical protein
LGIAHIIKSQSPPMEDVMRLPRIENLDLRKQRQQEQLNFQYQLSLLDMERCKCSVCVPPKEVRDKEDIYLPLKIPIPYGVMQQ